MAKSPTIVSVWSDVTGAANSVRDSIAATDRGVSVVVFGTKAFTQVNMSSNSTAGYEITFQFTLDTGW
jgi:phosphoribosylformimino-5-aminoimidazole carboxamide ribonucleotide (ProFAR) isomerase